MDNYRVILCFGEVEVSEDVESCEVSFPAKGPNLAKVEVSNEKLIEANPDYKSDVQIFFVIDGELHLEFTGFVISVRPQGETTSLTMTSGLQKTQEKMVGGLNYGRVDPREILWTMLLLSGMENDKIEIEGYEAGPSEVFEIATALDGVTVDKPIVLGDVRLLPSGPVSELATGRFPEELVERYAGGTSWAFVLRTAPTLLDAETEGLRTIDVSLAWLAVRTQYSNVSLPVRSKSRRFQRDWTRARISRRDVVFTRGLSTGRWWFRHPEGIAERPDLPVGEIEDIDSLPLPSNVSPQMNEAFSAWRRAVEETDPLAAVVALWECIEFYVSGISVDDLFTRAEHRAVLKRATEGLDGEKLERIREVIGNSNNAPLRVRLEEALEQDEVPCTADELLLLRKLRKLRNDFVHGRARKLPSEIDLRYAKAIVNRMLVYRVSNLYLTPTKESASGTVADLLRNIIERPLS